MQLALAAKRVAVLGIKTEDKVRLDQLGPGLWIWLQEGLILLACPM